jgi:hypothetical protein
MISDMLIAQLKATLVTTLTDTCTIYARASGTGLYGEPQQDAWVIVASAVPCRVIDDKQSRVGDPAVLAREYITDSYKLVVPAGTGLDVDQRIKVTSTGLEYDVTGLVTSRTQGVDEQAMIMRAR